MSKKEFDEVFTNPNKKKPQELESVIEPEKVEAPTEEPKKETEWEKYFKDLNEKYGEKVREVGQKAEYILPIMNGDGNIKKVTFSRKRPSVKELRLIAAKQKEYDEKPKKEVSLFEAEELASLYLEFAQMLLINSSTGKPITKDEFESQDWGFIRSVVDNCLLKSLVGSTG